MKAMQRATRFDNPSVIAFGNATSLCTREALEGHINLKGGANGAPF